MRHLFTAAYVVLGICAVLFMASLFSSCYAYLKADRLVYAGTVAKSTPEVVHVDSVDSVRIVVK